MIGREAFALGLNALAEAHGVELKETRLEIYYDQLAPHFTNQTWAETVHKTLRTSRYFPSIAELLEASSNSTDVAREAIEAYESIASLGDNSKWNYRWIRNAYGEHAARAFIDAGGFNAFAWCDERSEPFRRKAFVEAYRAETGGLPALPSREVAELGEGDEGAA